MLFPPGTIVFAGVDPHVHAVVAVAADEKVIWFVGDSKLEIDRKVLHRNISFVL